MSDLAIWQQFRAISAKNSAVPTLFHVHANRSRRTPCLGTGLTLLLVEERKACKYKIALSSEALSLIAQVQQYVRLLPMASNIIRPAAFTLITP
jgi:hypothetical protein